MKVDPTCAPGCMASFLADLSSYPPPLEVYVVEAAQCKSLCESFESPLAWSLHDHHTL